MNFTFTSLFTYVFSATKGTDRFKLFNSPCTFKQALPTFVNIIAVTLMMKLLHNTTNASGEIDISIIESQLKLQYWHF